MRVRIFLSHRLFTLPGEAAHVPSQTAVIEGVSDDASPRGVRVMAEAYLDDKGRLLTGMPADLLIPASKIDHVLILT